MQNNIMMLAIADVTPLHEPRNRGHLASLTESMQEDGWQGRPLLVIEREKDFLAWTGSHRIAAALAAGLSQIPCYVVQECELTKRGYGADHGHVEDYERLAILQKVGDETAIHIMWQEGRV